MNIKRRLTTGIATGALLLNALMPVAFADTTVTINGNGSDSENEAKVEFEQSTTVVQENSAFITNNVDVNADTGGNKASDNTGGDVSIDTGDADVDVNVSNAANVNSANVECCTGGDKTIEISKNGSDSENDVDLDWDNETKIFQDNKARFYNNVDVDANTGDNEAEDNTGDNDEVSIETGDANIGITVSNMANANFAVVGEGEEDSDVSLRITENGSDSENDIDLDYENSIVISQDNWAGIYNDVDVDAETGDNEAEDNTGDEVSIDTGDIDAEIAVHNLANFNWADLDCGCLIDDLTVEISKNGSDSKNDIELDYTFNNDKEEGVFQDNMISLNNDLEDIDLDTGDNEVEDNTGDPEIETGDIDSMVGVHNAVNANIVGDLSDVDWDELLEDFEDIEFVVDMDDLMAFFSLLKGMV